MQLLGVSMGRQYLRLGRRASHQPTPSPKTCSGSWSPQCSGSPSSACGTKGAADLHWGFRCDCTLGHLWTSCCRQGMGSSQCSQVQSYQQAVKAAVCIDCKGDLQPAHPIWLALDSHGSPSDWRRIAAQCIRHQRLPTTPPASLASQCFCH